MIIGIGTDMVDIQRIKATLGRHGSRFEMRCFSQEEQEKANSREKAGLKAQTYAKRFAAKEAFAKALGTGFRGEIVLKDIFVVDDEYGRPRLELRGGALERLNAIIPENMTPCLHLSLSDEPPYAQAFVIIEARNA